MNIDSIIAKPAYTEEQKMIRALAERIKKLEQPSKSKQKSSESNE